VGKHRLGEVLPGCVVAGQTRTAASQRKKRACRCCLEQTQFKVEAGAASMEVEAAATLSSVFSLREE